MRPRLAAGAGVELRLARSAFCLVLIVCLGCRVNGGPARSWDRAVVDSRGVAVGVPPHVRRVVTVSDGLVEGVMTRLGVAGSIVGIGSEALRRDWRYTFESASGGSHSFDGGLNPVLLLNPRFATLPLVAGDAGLNLEALAALEPDVVILRLGSCNLWSDDEKVRFTIEILESLGLPVVVLHGTHFAGRAQISTISREIRILGDLFDRRAEAAELAAHLEEQVAQVTRRTADVAPEEKATVLVFGPSPAARGQGGVGQVFGLDTIESFFIEELAHARNAYRAPGYFRIISAEHLLEVDPDVLVLCTAGGYHPPQELYEAPYYRDLRGLRAIGQRRVAALPWTPWNCAKRLEYPIEVMVIAKAAYPERFADIDLGEWLLDFYRTTYLIDRATAERIRSAQWMDWTVEEAAISTGAPG